MNTTLSKREANRQRWFEHIHAWQRSGLKQKAFCEQQRLGLASFQRWLRIVRAEDKVQPQSSVSFLPVKINRCASHPLIVHLNNDLRLEIPVDVDPLMLTQIVQALQSV